MAFYLIVAQPGNEFPLSQSFSVSKIPAVPRVYFSLISPFLPAVKIAESEHIIHSTVSQDIVAIAGLDTSQKGLPSHYVSCWSTRHRTLHSI